MDVRLSAEQRALRDSTAQVVARLGPKAVGQLDDQERISKLDAAVAASGWRELRTADGDGRPWASGVEVGIVAEELARGLADAAFVGPTLAAELRRVAGLPPAPAPETVALLPDLSTLAHAGGDAVAIDAGGAVCALVLVPGGAGASLASVAVPVGAGDVDLTRVTIPLRDASGTPLSDSGVIDDESRARWTALGLATTCADLVGAMQGATDLAVEYAQQRKQYGTPIGAFQAIQHLLADAAVHTEGSRSATLHAMWAVDALDPVDALAAAATAKAYCARAARIVCETAIQVHGGIGNTWDCLAHVYLRRALLSIEILGGVGPSLARVLEHAGITSVGRGRSPREA